MEQLAGMLIVQAEKMEKQVKESMKKTRRLLSTVRKRRRAAGP